MGGQAGTGCLRDHMAKFKGETKCGADRKGRALGAEGRMVWRGLLRHSQWFDNYQINPMPCASVHPCPFLHIPSPLSTRTCLAFHTSITGMPAASDTQQYILFSTVCIELARSIQRGIIMSIIQYILFSTVKRGAAVSGN